MLATTRRLSDKTGYVLEFETRKEYDELMSSLSAFLKRNVEDDAFAGSVSRLATLINARVTDQYANENFVLSCLFFEDEVADMLLDHIYRTMIVAMANTR